MQLVGELCAICSRGISFQREATWCAACKSVMHVQCAAEANELCPKCGRTFEHPETRFAFSQFCPECMTPTKTQQTTCGNCGASTCWDTLDAYNRFKLHMMRTSRRYFFRGVGEIFLGCLCLLALISLLVLPLQASFSAYCGFLAGFVFLVSDGIVRMLRSRTIARFE